MKRLTLLRHAKSSWGDAGQSDFERSLNKRGKENAPVMGRRLSRRSWKPDLIVTSPAKRARKTASLVADEMGVAKEAIVRDARIYEASLADLLEIIGGLDDETFHAMLVGHNPAFTDLANTLLPSVHIPNIPTCGAVGIDFEGESWSDVAPGTGALVFFDFPKNLQADDA